MPNSLHNKKFFYFFLLSKPLFPQKAIKNVKINVKVISVLLEPDTMQSFNFG